MNLEELQKEYEELRNENENLKYHIGLLLMMLPKEKNYDFFQYAITMDFSRTETAKILKTLMKINAKFKNHNIDSNIYVVGSDMIAFDTDAEIETYGTQFVKYLSDIFDVKRNINPVAILKMCKAQGIYTEVCDFLLDQIDEMN